MSCPTCKDYIGKCPACGSEQPKIASEFPADIIEAAKQAERVLMRAPFPDGGWQAIARAILAERERHGWQPIETAPKDGTEIIGVFVNDYGYQPKPTVYGPWTMKWGGKEWESSWDGCRVVCSQTDFGTEYHDLDLEPTHWHPLPMPPKP